MSRILLVEDLPEHREFYACMLRSVGYAVVTAGDAEAALLLASRERFALALLDFYLPDRNGIELAWSLRGLKCMAGVPMVMLSAENDSNIRNLAQGAGIRCWLSKPVSIDELLATVREYAPLGPVAPAPQLPPERSDPL
ncbi:MAG: response regulator [Gammaproteobacteria bacterium]|nr:response regulator [Gammaproteobacteria bacterium]